MSADKDDSEKIFDPTPQKLLEMRKKGDVARSPDLVTAASYFGFTVSIVILGSSMADDLGALLKSFFTHSSVFSSAWPFSPPESHSDVIFEIVAIAVFPVAIGSLLFSLATLIFSRTFLFTSSNLHPKISRISPISNARNRFGKKGLLEFLKSCCKLFIYSAIFSFFLFNARHEILASSSGSSWRNVSLLFDLLIRLFLVVTVTSMVLGAMDFLWQRHEFMQKHRMSRKEIQDESKESEGDPHFKQERRSRGQQIALNQMLREVPESDVVIVNPTHFAVALKWSRAAGSAPVCVAKGVDETALRIRSIAVDADVPVHDDPPTARSLFAHIDIGQQIHPEHFEAVAAAIRFADSIRRKAKLRV